LNIPEVLKEVAKILADQGHECYLVGGALRDMFRVQKPSDFDLAVSCGPETVIKIFRKIPNAQVIPTGIKHGTVTLLIKGESLELTTFRVDGGYEDGRHPLEVSRAANITEDLSRRDFTMNAIALELPDAKNIIDPFDGRADIKNKIIRAVGNAEARFTEDGLRPLRALRFASQLQFTLDSEILAAIPRTLNITAKVSAERIRDEFDKIVDSACPSLALVAMRETGLMKLILPELDACAGVEQKGYHKFDVFTHSLLALDYAAAHNVKHTVRLAALFHDLGKVSTGRYDSERQGWTFYNHDKVSVELTFDIMKRFKYPNDVRDAVCHLVSLHMFYYTDDWSDGAVRRFIVKVEGPGLKDAGFDELFFLRRADAYALAKIEMRVGAHAELINRIEGVKQKNNALSLNKLAINGTDLMNAGFESGKNLGIILKYLMECVLEDPDQNEKNALLNLAINYSKSISAKN
jgi:putative nucleotidyltransferase with HDIG domain